MSELLIQHTPKGWQLVSSGNGLPPYTKIGPPWPTPREAARFYDMQYMFMRRRVSPLREEADWVSGGSASSQSDWAPGELTEAYGK